MTDASPSSSPPPIPTTQTSYVKLIRKDRTHNCLVLQEGLNCLKETETFNDRPECGPRGLYFCKEEDVNHWLSLYNPIHPFNPLIREHSRYTQDRIYFCREEDIKHRLKEYTTDIGYVATVTLCPDSICVSLPSQHKLKTDRFILGPFQPIEEFMTSERAEQAVQKNMWALRFVSAERQSAVLFQTAVQANGFAFTNVPTDLKTEKCLAAVRQNGRLLKFVPAELKSAMLCYEAVRQTLDALPYVPRGLDTTTLWLKKNNPMTARLFQVQVQGYKRRPNAV